MEEIACEDDERPSFEAPDKTGPVAEFGSWDGVGDVDCDPGAPGMGGAIDPCWNGFWIEEILGRFGRTCPGAACCGYP